MRRACNCNRPQFSTTDKIRWWAIVPKAELEKKVVAVVGDIGDLLEVRITKRAPPGW